MSLSHSVVTCSFVSCFFFFNDTATTEIYTLSLHDALPIAPSTATVGTSSSGRSSAARAPGVRRSEEPRLNSSHMSISYAVFCLKKKKINIKTDESCYLKRLTTLSRVTDSHRTRYIVSSTDK